MTKLLTATYEHGKLRPTKALKLPEHQRVLLAIVIPDDEIPAIFLSKLAETSKNFGFLNSPQEDIYSLSDGKKT